MIFVTVGNLDPFDRLIRAFDEWLAEQPGPVEAIAQIGMGTYRPQHCRWVDFRWCNVPAVNSLSSWESAWGWRSEGSRSEP